MNERLGPGEMLAKNFRFEKAVSFFPEEEQSLAEHYLDIYRRYHKSLAIDFDVHEALVDYCAQNRGMIENCKLFHLFAGSSLPRERWMSIPMDTANGDMEEFIENTLVPLLEKKAA